MISCGFISKPFSWQWLILTAVSGRRCKRPFIVIRNGVFITLTNLSLISFSFLRTNKQTNKQTHSVVLIRKRTIPTERPPFVSEVSANFSGRNDIVWSEQRIPTALNFGFLYRNRYFSIQVAPQLSSRSWVDPVPGPILLRKSGCAGIELGTSGPVARTSDH
jgi:hypothetical protein